MLFGEVGPHHGRQHFRRRSTGRDALHHSHAFTAGAVRGLGEHLADTVSLADLESADLILGNTPLPPQAIEFYRHEGAAATTSPRPA